MVSMWLLYSFDMVSNMYGIFTWAIIGVNAGQYSSTMGHLGYKLPHNLLMGKLTIFDWTIFKSDLITRGYLAEGRFGIR